jgi:hypothetical protein
VIVNVVGAASTSLVAALNRWRLMRVKLMAAVGSGVEAAALARRVIVDVTETTALLGDGGQSPPYLKGKERQVEEGNAWDLMHLMPN